MNLSTKRFTYICCFLISMLPLLGHAQTDLQYSLTDLSELLRRAGSRNEVIRYNARLSNFYLNNKLPIPANLESALYFAKKAQAAEQKSTGVASLQSGLIAVAKVMLGKSDPKYVLHQLTNANTVTRSSLLLLTAQYYLYRAGEEKNDLDSALTLFRQSAALGKSLNNSHIQHAAALYIADLYQEQGQNSKARRSFINLIKACKNTGDWENAAGAASRFGDHLPYEKEKLDYYILAKNLYDKAGNTEARIGMEKGIADAMLHMGRLDDSKELLLSVLGQYQKLGYKNLQFTYDLLSAVSHMQGKYQNALFYSIKAIEYMKKTGSDASKGYFLANLGGVYAELGNLNESVSYYQRSLESMENQDQDARLTSLKFLSEELLKKGHVKEILSLVKKYDDKQLRAFGKKTLATIRGNCYTKTKQYVRAEKYYLDMISWQNELPSNSYPRAESYYTIAEFYVLIKAYDKAEHYLHKLLAMEQKFLPLSKLRNTYLYLYQADSAQNNLNSAIGNYKSYKILNDSLQSASRNRNIQELLIEYQTNQKEQDNELLRKESALQKINLHRAGLITRITIGGLIALLFIIGLLYYSFRSRKNATRLMVSHQQEITLKNDSLQNLIDRQAKLLSEKEWLIKEIHHRIKNNLQVITSLLNAQSNYLQNDAALSAIRDSQNRIQSISLIHQKLFQSESVALINIHEYIVELMKFLCETFHVNQRIQFEFDIPEIQLDITQAMPLGLIINEAVTNIIKYAFPESRPGKVSFSLSEDQDGFYNFSINDNGIGLPENFDAANTSSLGITLIKGLGDQLGGEVLISSNKGVRISLVFPKESNIIS